MVFAAGIWVIVLGYAFISSGADYFAGNPVGIAQSLGMTGGVPTATTGNPNSASTATSPITGSRIERRSI